jgi:transcriptional regulator CtsR
MVKKFHRSDWPKAIVTATEPGTGGFVRIVRVRTSNGTEYHRNIRKLALLEAAGEMSATVTSRRCLTNNNVSTPIANSQDMQVMQACKLRKVCKVHKVRKICKVRKVLKIKHN